MWPYDDPMSFNLQGGNQLDIFDLIGRGIDVVGSTLSHSPYLSPNDPRYGQRNAPPVVYGSVPTQSYNHCNGLQLGGSVGAGGTVGGGGVCLPWWGLALGGALILSYFGGKSRGSR